MEKTKIEWCDSTVNPIMGCTGCALRKNHCYAAALCTRYAGRKGWPASFDQPEFFPGRLEAAVKWKDLTGKNRPDKSWFNGRPRHIFVNNLSDGFCPDVNPDEWLPPQLLGQMAASPHVWMLLTKWPDRMRTFLERYRVPDNFWLGVSVENQAAADERIPLLLQCLAAVHYVSVEPMLAAVDLRHYLDGMPEPYGGGHRGYVTRDMAIDAEDLSREGEDLGWQEPEWQQTAPPLDWVICGGESGLGARSMDEDWVRDLRDQCVAASVPFFYKQKLVNGHKVSIPKLDGREWREWPR